MIEQIIVGQQYVMTVRDCPTELNNAGLTEMIGKDELEGLLVTIVKVVGADEGQQVTMTTDIVLTGHTNMCIYWWPPCCFKPVPVPVEFVVGEYYICNRKPSDFHQLGWSARMTDWLGQPLKCTRIEEKNGWLSPESYTGSGCTYMTHHVRPFKQPSKIVKRNVFNLWPGN